MRWCFHRALRGAIRRPESPCPGPATGSERPGCSSPSGGGCRLRQVREKMHGASVGNRLSFSLIRQPPRGRLAAATFPRWGKAWGGLPRAAAPTVKRKTRTIFKSSGFCSFSYFQPSGRYFAVLAIMSSTSCFTSSSLALPLTRGSLRKASYTNSRSQVNAAFRVRS